MWLDGRKPAGLRGRNAKLRISREAHLRLVSALEGEHVAEHSDDVGHGCKCWTLRRRPLRLCSWREAHSHSVDKQNADQSARVATDRAQSETRWVVEARIIIGRGCACRRGSEWLKPRQVAFSPHRKEMTRYADYGCVRQLPQRTLLREPVLEISPLRSISCADLRPPANPATTTATSRRR